MLYAPGDTIYKRLNDPENHKSVAEALASIGITSFEIRKKGEKADPVEADIETLKKNFPDADIDIR